jgi:hypothetical protein
LDRALAEARAGRTTVLVLRGEAGIGKSVLIEHAAARSSGCRVLRAAGVESEMELPFASLHQLCGPLLDDVHALPEPQRAALDAAFGQRTAAPPDRFILGLGLLSLLLVAAGEPTGDPTLLWRALAHLDIPVEATSAAESAGLLHVGARVTFRHPLLRSAVYGAASPEDRRTAHGALAEVTDQDLDPDRRAWHRAQATLGPDETRSRAASTG